MPFSRDNGMFDKSGSVNGLRVRHLTPNPAEMAFAYLHSLHLTHSQRGNHLIIQYQNSRDTKVAHRCELPLQFQVYHLKAKLIDLCNFLGSPALQ